MKPVICAVVLTLLVLSAKAQVPFPGHCPAVTVQQAFVPQNYLGEWYEYKKYFAIFQAGGTCVTAKYTDNGNGVIGVVNRQFNPLLKRYNTIVGTATSTSTTGEAKLGVRFPSAGGFQGNYWVLGTDYTSFSVVWSCTDLLFFNIQFAWVLTRDRQPSPAVLAAADAIIKKNGISLGAFSVTPQSNCP